MSPSLRRNVDVHGRLRQQAERGGAWSNEARGILAAVDLVAPSYLISLEGLVDELGGPHLVSTADRISTRLRQTRDDEASGDG